MSGGVRYTQAEFEFIFGTGKKPQKAVKKHSGYTGKRIVGDTALEKDFEQYLTLLQRAGGIVKYYKKCGSWVIGAGLRYNPDFMIVYSDCIQFIEVKPLPKKFYGTGKVPAFVRNSKTYDKIKTAQMIYPCFKWAYAFKEYGQWVIKGISNPNEVTK